MTVLLTTAGHAAAFDRMGFATDGYDFEGLLGIHHGVLALTGVSGWDRLAALRAAGLRIPCVVLSEEPGPDRWALEPVAWIPRAERALVDDAIEAFGEGEYRTESVGDVLFDGVLGTLHAGGISVDLTSRETQLLARIFDRAPAPLAWSEAWEGASDKAVRMTVSRLRRRLSKAGLPDIVWTVGRRYTLARADCVEGQVRTLLQSDRPAIGGRHGWSWLQPALDALGPHVHVRLEGLEAPDRAGVLTVHAAREPALVVLEDTRVRKDALPRALWWVDRGAPIALPPGIADDREPPGLDLESLLSAFLRQGSTQAFDALASRCESIARHRAHRPQSDTAPHRLALMLLGEAFGVAHWVEQPGIEGTRGPWAARAWLHAVRLGSATPEQATAHLDLSDSDTAARLDHLLDRPVGMCSDPDLRALLAHDHNASRRQLAETDRDVAAAIERLLEVGRLPLALFGMTLRMRSCEALGDRMLHQALAQRLVAVGRRVTPHAWRADAAVCGG